jgi:hypothetical protein
LAIVVVAVAAAAAWASPARPPLASFDAPDPPHAPGDRSEDPAGRARGIDIWSTPSFAGIRDGKTPAGWTSLGPGLEARFPWLPPPLFDVFGPPPVETYDPRTGAPSAYAEAVPRFLPERAAR